MAQIRSTFPGAAQYEQALAGTAMTEGRLRNVIADNVRIETYVDQRFGAAAQPTSEEVQRYYLEHPVVFTRDGRLAPFDDVQVQAQERLAAERRRALITDWLRTGSDGGASVTTLLTPGRWVFRRPEPPIAGHGRPGFRSGVFPAMAARRKPASVA